jgi:ribosomal protein S18 acetylase RimI-like enzyme
MTQYVRAHTAAEIDVVHALLREYQQSIGVDLCFQGFEAELKGLPGSYAPPSGRLLLAFVADLAVGCIALQRVDDTRCEMKRLYVRPTARGLGIGRALVARVLEEARAVGYTEVVLDTLPTMVQAQRLYEQLGFHEIPPYRANPIAGARYMGLPLTRSQSSMRASSAG